MHMADVLLSPAVGGVMYAASAAGMGAAIHKIRQQRNEQILPLMAVSGAFVFAAQMINFTIPGTGSSGHIGGGILLAGMLGGAPALLTIAVVLVIQCLFFADGGLLALGANIFNMGVLPCLLVYPLLFRPILKKRRTPGWIMAASVLSAVVGLQLGAFGVVVETFASGVTELPFREFVLLMQPIHLAIGLVEGVITGLILNFVYRMQPEILKNSLGENAHTAGKTTSRVVLVLAVCAFLIGGGLSLYASSNPDGLEWAIQNVTGQEELERENETYDTAAEIQDSTAILPDYDYSEENDSGISGTTLAGIVGGILTFVLAGAVGFAIRISRKRKKHAAA